MRLLVPGLLVGGSMLAIALGASAAVPSGASGSVVDAEGQVAHWQVQQELLADGTLGWTVILDLPETTPDYLYDLDTGDLVAFDTLEDARDFALGFLEGQGFGG